MHSCYAEVDLWQSTDLAFQVAHHRLKNDTLEWMSLLPFLPCQDETIIDLYINRIVYWHMHSMVLAAVSVVANHANYCYNGRW